MSTWNLFIAAVLAHVTLITAAALLFIGFARPRSGFRHSVGVAGLLLIVCSPLLALVQPRPAWIAGAKSHPPVAASVLGRIPPLQAESEPFPPFRSVEFSGVDPGAMSPIAEADNSPPLTPAMPDLEMPEFDSPAVELIAPIVEPPQAVQTHSDDIRRPGWFTVVNGLCLVWFLGGVFLACGDWRRRRTFKVVIQSGSAWDVTSTRQSLQEVCLALGLKHLPQVCVSDLPQTSIRG